VAVSGVKAQNHQRDIDRYVGCLGGVQIIERFNATYQQLADIERTQKTNPTLAAKRIHAYENSIVRLPKDPCGRDPRKR
jgi:hypothetical protein